MSRLNKASAAGPPKKASTVKAPSARASKHILTASSPAYLPSCPSWAQRDLMWTALNLPKNFELQELDSGGSANVTLARHKTNKHAVVIKSYFRQALLTRTNLCAKVRNEWDVQGQLEHPNIVPLLLGLEDKNTVSLVLEHQSCDLYAHLSTPGESDVMDEEAARSVVFDLLSALAYMHEQGVVHRDVKSENIFKAGPQYWKLGDLGSAVLLDPATEVRGLEGTLPFAAPEYAKLWTSRTREQLKAATTPKLDVWGVGAVAYDILIGTPPFNPNEDDSDEAIINATCSHQLTLPSTLSPALCDFLKSALEKDADSRPTAAQLLQHPWVTA